MHSHPHLHTHMHAHTRIHTHTAHIADSLPSLSFLHALLRPENEQLHYNEVPLRKGLNMDAPPDKPFPGSSFAGVNQFFPFIPGLRREQHGRVRGEVWFFDIMFLITYNNWIIIPTVFERYLL